MKDHLILLIQIVKNDRDTVKAVAIKILFDFILVYGLKALDEDSLEDVLVSIDYF